MSTQTTDRTNRRPGPKSGDGSGKKKFGLVLQGAAALGAYEVGAIKYLYARRPARGRHRPAVARAR